MTIDTFRFPPEFYQQLLVAHFEELVATYNAQDEAMKSGKPVILYDPHFCKKDERQMTNEPYTVTIKAPLLRAGLEITIGPMSKKYAAQATLDALDIVRTINMARVDKNAVGDKK